MKCGNCCHSHSNGRCALYHDSLCDKVYGFCNGEHYDDKSLFISVPDRIRRLKGLQAKTIPKASRMTGLPHTEFILIEHPNGHYWKIMDTMTGKEYAKKEATELVNRLIMRMSYLEELLDMPVMVAEDINMDNGDCRISAYTIQNLIIRQDEKIRLLEEMLDDVEMELEEIEMENRRLKDGLDNNDTG